VVQRGQEIHQECFDSVSIMFGTSLGESLTLSKRRSLCSKFIHECLFYLYTGIHFLLNASLRKRRSLCSKLDKYKLHTVFQYNFLEF
jgi:hypothetical protein